jgi:hypothetical protein
MGYKDYICRELSPVLRDELKAELSNELSIFEDRIKERAVDVFQKLANKVLNRYQMKIKMTPPASPSGFNDEADNIAMPGERSTTLSDASSFNVTDLITFEDLDFDNLQIPLAFGIGELQTHPHDTYPNLGIWVASDHECASRGWNSDCVQEAPQTTSTISIRAPDTNEAREFDELGWFDSS